MLVHVTMYCHRFIIYHMPMRPCADVLIELSSLYEQMVFCKLTKFICMHFPKIDAIPIQRNFLIHIDFCITRPESHECANAGL